MEPTLEQEVNKPSKFSRLVSQFKQWQQPENKPYPDHYLANCVKILLGYEPTDYTRVSHENKLVHSSMPRSRDKVSPYNKLVNSGELGQDKTLYHDEPSPMGHSPKP